MFKRKFVRQENLKDCGAACLLMIIRHYGGNYPLERLRQMMMTDKSGISAYNLIETAKKIGFDARGYKNTSFENLKNNSIVHVIINKTYHHYVVIDKVYYDKKVVTILDPSVGYKKYSFDEFDKIWSHIMITLYPISKIVNINTFKNTKQTIRQIIKPYKRSFTLIFFLSVIYTILNVINTFYLKIIVDDLYVSSQSYFFILFLTIFMTKTMVDYLRSKVIIKLNYNVDKNLMSDTFKHLLSLPINYFDSKVTGDLLTRVIDLSYVKELIVKLSSFMFIDLLMIVSSCIVLYVLNKLLLSIVLIMVIIYILIVLIFNRTVKSYIIRGQEKESISSTKIIEVLKGIHTIKNLNVEKEMYNDVILKYDDLINNDYYFNKKYNLIKMLKEYVLGSGTLLIIFISGLLIKQGLLEVGEFITFIFMLNMFLEPIKHLFEMEPLFRSSVNALVRTSEFYDTEEEEANRIGMRENSIIFSNVSFSYNGLSFVFENLNMVIDNNDRVMIAGPSGIGKSTIAKIIAGNYKVSSGVVYIGNNDITNYSLKELSENVCYISQDEKFFTDSLYNNIKLDRIIDDNELAGIINITGVDEIMKKHQLDYHMLIEEDACNLSGGEKNSIMIARSLLKNSKIIIIDEGTSQMNIELERRVFKNILNKFKDRTIIVVTHRFDNSDLFNKIITFDENKEMEVLI